MSLSLRARLTFWYGSSVVAVLASGIAAASWAQSHFLLDRMDDELTRAMATLQGVMRTELHEGLTLSGAADEASSEVVAPGRTLVVAAADGRVLRVWGPPVNDSVIRFALSSGQPATLEDPSGSVRVLTRAVEERGEHYTASAIASLTELRAQERGMVEALSLGAAAALFSAVIGGWLIGWQALKPLARMADQAARIDARNPTERLEIQTAADELRQMGEAFNGLLDRLTGAIDQQRQFMADASHELRTPVSVVRTASEVALSRPDRSGMDYRESLSIVREQATRLSKLVDAMFLLSRAEANGVPLTEQYLHLDEAVAESVRAFQVLATERSVSVSLRGDEEVSMVGDDALLRRMIGNLLDNAIRHARHGGHVEVHLRRSATLAVLDVIDDGQGVAPADYARVFERFVRIGNGGGSGLGLPIAKWIAEAHGGALVLTASRPGRTVFTATLPLTRNAQADTATPVPATAARFRAAVARRAETFAPR